MEGLIFGILRYVSVNGNIPPLDATSTTYELRIPLAIALSSNAARSKSPRQGWTGEKSTHVKPTKTRFAGVPREHFRSFYKKVEGKTRVPVEGIFKVRRGY